MATDRPRTTVPRACPSRWAAKTSAESLRIINEFRATRNLAPISEDFLKLNPFVSLDLRLTKDFSITSGSQLQLFLEGYNVLNRVNYAGGGNGSLSSSALLIRNAARDARQVQIGARVTF